MRFLFKPGWIAFVLVVIAFAVACYTLLAPWQFRRNAERSLENTQIAASFANPPRPLAELVPAGSAPDPSLTWRQASVRGEYLTGDEAVVRLRTVLGRPAFEVLTAFRTDDGRTVAVDRGYVRPGDGRQVTEYPPAPGGTVTLVGRIQLDESDPQHRASLNSGGHRQLYAADSQLLAAAIGSPVSPGYLELVDGQPGGLGVLPLPDTDSGPFLSYAWQWLTFGAMALFGLGYFVRLELLQRRGPVDEQDDDFDDEPCDGEELAGVAPAQPAGVVPGRALSSRASLRAALRGDQASTESSGPGTPGRDTPDPGPAEPPRPEPARDRLVDRYGKARF
ncbi:MAG TPA: SURF1 family cytochrome oxidase biogenesis protein [Pseudonocardia sp.]|nr:SURF1 family cytochrome oxidase biogenesis protein [Pseudonocardia sp.]